MEQEGDLTTRQYLDEGKGKQETESAGQFKRTDTMMSETAVQTDKHEEKISGENVAIIDHQQEKNQNITFNRADNKTRDDNQEDNKTRDDNQEDTVKHNKNNSKQVTSELHIKPLHVRIIANKSQQNVQNENGSYGHTNKQNTEIDRNEQQALLKESTLKPLRRTITIQKLDPLTSHIRMEEIQWQRVMERKQNREEHERELARAYREEVHEHIRNIERQKKSEQQLMKKRLTEIEKKRRMNNNTFNRILQRKDNDYRLENQVLQQRIQAIDRQKVINIEKLKARVSNLEERKRREQDLFVQRMQKLERMREEEFEASNKRQRDIEKRKMNERKTWLLRVQRIDGLKKESVCKTLPALSIIKTDTNNCQAKPKENNAGHNESTVRYMMFPKTQLKPKIRKKRENNQNCTGIEIVGAKSGKTENDKVSEEIYNENHHDNQDQDLMNFEKKKYRLPVEINASQ